MMKEDRYGNSPGDESYCCGGLSVAQVRKIRKKHAELEKFKKVKTFSDFKEELDKIRVSAGVRSFAYEVDLEYAFKAGKASLANKICDDNGC